MIIEVSVDFLVKHEITFEQYALCYMLHEDKYEININGQRRYTQSGPAIANVYKYSQSIGKWDKKALNDLVEKGILKRLGNRNSPDMLEVTDKFAKLMFADMSDFEQLFDLYPSHLDFGPGKAKGILKACNKEEVEKSYKIAVRTKAKHKYIMDITRWAKKHNMLNLSFEKYVKGRYWEVLKDDYENQTAIETKDQEMLL